MISFDNKEYVHVYDFWEVEHNKFLFMYDGTRYFVNASDSNKSSTEVITVENETDNWVYSKSEVNVTGIKIIKEMYL